MDNVSEMEQSKPKNIKSKIFGDDIFDLSVSSCILFSGILTLLVNSKFYGTDILYWVSGCYALLLICVVWCLAAFVKKLKRHEVKAQQVVTIILIFVILAAWSVGETIYAKDIFGGTETITTEYYAPREKSILIYQEFDGIEFKNSIRLYCTEKISAPVLENFSFDESEKRKISDHIWAYKSIPKIEIEYYPNTEFIKEINIL